MRRQSLIAVTVTAVVLSSAIAVLGVPARAQSGARPEDVGLSAERLRRVSELVKRHIDAGSFSGAVTLVARHGRVAHLEAQGLMDVESRTPMRKDAIVRIMSMTKPVVGAAILILVEEGKVRLNDPVSRFIPEMKELKVAVAQPPAGAAAATPAEPRFYTIPAEREITVRDLLTHTSGLVSGPIGSAESARVAAVGAGDTLATAIPRLARVPLEFQPGTRWAYSGRAGFDVLLRVVEVASGMAGDQFLRQRIFEPLGMKDTAFYPLTGNPRMATPYRTSPGGLLKQPDPELMNGTYFFGGGGLVSTAEDYLQFAHMLLSRGQASGRRLLSPRAVTLMSSLAVPDTLPGRPRGEGFGLSVRVVNDPAARGSFLSPGSYGWSGAYGTHFWVDPKEELVGILMIQTPTRDMGVDFENAVMQAVIGGPAGTAGTN